MAKVTDLKTHKNTIPGAVEALEQLTELAKAGKLRCAVVIALEHEQEDTHTVYFSEGSCLEQIWVLGALSQAQNLVHVRMRGES